MFGAPIILFMIKFIKTLKYETKPKNRDIFDYLCDLSLQKIDPPSTAGKFIRLESSFILHSPLRRVKETVLTSKYQQSYALNELREIPFDLAKLCSRQEWNDFGSKIVRARFTEAFIKDELELSREQVVLECEKVFNYCLSQDVKFLEVVSHSFRLKIIEAYIDTKGELAFKPELLANYISSGHKTYEFGQGFIVQREDLKFI